MKIDLLPMIVQLLYQLAIDLKLEEYVYHYWKDFPLFCSRNISSYVSSQCNKIIIILSMLANYLYHVLVQYQFYPIRYQFSILLIPYNIKN